MHARGLPRIEGVAHHSEGRPPHDEFVGQHAHGPRVHRLAVGQVGSLLVVRGQVLVGATQHLVVVVVGSSIEAKSLQAAPELKKELRDI